MHQLASGPCSWFGGKGHMVAKLLPLIPHTRIYVEPYGGMGSILFARRPTKVEVYNDLDDEAVNLMRVLQIPKWYTRLKRRLKYTPYSQSEFRRALEARHSEDIIDRAWGFFVAFNQCFCGPHNKTQGHWSRGLAHSPSNRWVSHKRSLEFFHTRLSRCQIDNRSALVVIKYWDSPDTAFYLDPPYVPDTRISKRVYKNEPTIRHHRRLVKLLLDIDGCAVLSGYAHDVYKPLEDAGWTRTDFDMVCAAAGTSRESKLHGKGNSRKHAQRVESVWRNPRAVELCRGRGLWHA